MYIVVKYLENRFIKFIKKKKNIELNIAIVCFYTFFSCNVLFVYIYNVFSRIR